MDALLTNRTEDAPSGENLEYEPVFAALELAAQPGEEKQVGEDIVVGDPPDFVDVIAKATAVLEQSHDLRAAMHLAVAEIHVNGFPGFAEVTGYMRGCLEQFWATCHPQLDEEDDDDPTMRVNAVIGLVDDALILRPLRMAPLTKSNAFGMVSLRDIDVSKGDAAALEDAQELDEAAIGAAFKDTDPEVLQSIYDAVVKALDDIKAIDGVFNDNIPGQGPDLTPIMRVLQRASTTLGDATGVDTADEPAPDGVEGEEATGGASAAAPAPAVPGAINSSKDVEMALDRIMEYYAEQEPSSPVPTILGRAKRLVGADFLTIMKDMAPDGIANVRSVGGLEDDD